MKCNDLTLLHALCDEELFTRFAAGDDDAYTALYHRYSARVLSYIHSILGSDKASEDIFQETFLRLFRERKRYADTTEAPRPIRNVGGWLFRVARNLSLNQLRSARYRADLPEGHSEEIFVSVEEAHPHIFGDHADEERLIQAVHSAVQTLPKGLREAFVLREVNGMSYEETAAIIGCSTEAARMRLSRARTSIRKAVQSLFVHEKE